MKFLKILMLILFNLNVHAQDSVRVVYGKNTSRWFVVPEKGILLQLKRNDYLSLTSVSIDVKLHSNSEAYKKMIELFGSVNDFHSVVEESNKSGRYLITLAPIKQKLLKQKGILVTLMQNPANRRSMMPSKRTILAEIIFK